MRVVYLEWPKDREIHWHCIEPDVCPKRVKQWGKSPVNRERIYVVDLDEPPIVNKDFLKNVAVILIDMKCTLLPFPLAILLCAVGNNRRFHSICNMRRNCGPKGR